MESARPRSDRGFSLPEVSVAILVLAVVTAVVAVTPPHFDEAADPYRLARDSALSLGQVLIRASAESVLVFEPDGSMWVAGRQRPHWSWKP